MIKFNANYDNNLNKTGHDSKFQIDVYSQYCVSNVRIIFSNNILRNKKWPIKEKRQLVTYSHQSKIQYFDLLKYYRNFFE